MKRNHSGGTPQFRFMEGRYGPDAYGRFLAITGCVIVIISLILRALGSGVLAGILLVCALGLIIWC